MLPIRLGMVNADGPQELFVYALSRRGRVETTNYRTVSLPTGMDVPLFVKTRFSDFYKAMFSEQVKKEDMRTVFTEYAWDMSFCDPCAADPLSSQELHSSESIGRRAAPHHFPETQFQVLDLSRHFSHGCTCAMTTPIFPKISSFRKPVIAPTFRDDTSCATRGPVKGRVQLQPSIDSNCRNDARRKPARSPR